MAVVAKDVETSLVLVLKQPVVTPFNPFDLIDAGLFTRDEVKKGPMDFGPGYVLHSKGGYQFLREINRFQLLFDRNTSSDYQLIERVAKSLVDSLKLPVVAMGVNFLYSGVRELSKSIQDHMEAIANVIASSGEAASGYSCVYACGDVRCTLAISPRRVITGSLPSDVYDISINNHIQFTSEKGFVSQISRTQTLKQSFEALLTKVVK